MGQTEAQTEMLKLDQLTLSIKVSIQKTHFQQTKDNNFKAFLTQHRQFSHFDC